MPSVVLNHWCPYRAGLNYAQCSVDPVFVPCPDPVCVPMVRIFSVVLCVPVEPVRIIPSVLVI